MLLDAGEEQRQTAFLVVVGLLVVYYITGLIKYHLYGLKAAYVGYRSKWEPTWLLRLRFIRGSVAIIGEGYKNFKDSVFVIRRNDKDIAVISHKNVDTLRNLPAERLSPIEAQIMNLLGHWSTTDLFLEGNLHTRTVQQRLTPQLGLLLPVVKQELDYALRLEIPKCDDWITVDIADRLVHIVARLSARLFVGPVICRNQDWIDTSIHYTENVFATVMFMRLFPAMLHPLIAPCLPSYWRLHQNLATAKRLVGSTVIARRKAQMEGRDEKHDDFLQWMMEDPNLSSSDGRPDKLAHRQLILSLAAIHTTSMAATHALYDLCAHPEYLEPLRDELVAVLKEDGGWCKQTLNKLVKLDSFLKESQRINPPSQLSFNRVVKQSPLELVDGTILPVGTHFNMAAHAILLDPENLPGGGDPHQFDGFRYARLRQLPGNSNKYQWATTENTSLHFGHGTYGCPGRFLASNEIKMVFGHLVLGFDFKYPSGSKRPVNLTADDNFYPDPDARLLMRRRKDLEPHIEALLGLRP